jgi:hypothetical protein
MEIFLFEELRKNYPNLLIEANSKTAVGSELDLYFPELKWAIELNGIFHYEPIYGIEKLNQIQRNDVQKFAACRKAGIELCIIDISQCKYLTGEAKSKYYSIVKERLDDVMSRR